MDFYVYVHKKKTNGEVFYVGKGSGKRAWSAFGRNSLWKRTADKYGWLVEIVQDNLQDWYAFELERDLISYYGRRDLGHGNLTNMSDGGDGPSKMNPEAVKRALVLTLNRGITVYKGERGFMKESFEQSAEVDIIFTIVTRLEVRKLRNIVHEIDPKAFIFTSTVREPQGGIVKEIIKH